MKIFVWGYIEQLLCGRLNNVESQNTFESCRYHHHYWAIYDDNSRHCLFHIWTRWSWSEETTCETKVCTQFPGPGIAKTILSAKIKIVRLMFGLLKVPSNVYRLMRTWRLGQNLKCQGPISFSRPDIFLKVWWEKWNMEIRRQCGGEIQWVGNARDMDDVDTRLYWAGRRRLHIIWLKYILLNL